MHNPWTGTKGGDAARGNRGYQANGDKGGNFGTTVTAQSIIYI